MKRFARYAAAISLPLLVMVASVPVLAVNANAQSRVDARDSTQQTTTVESTKLTETKLRVCNQRKKSINNIMTRIADRGQKQLNLFDSIATKVEEFYTAKGRTVSNYDTVKAEVDAKKAAATTAIEEIRTTSTTFDCDSTNPKGATDSFKASLQKEIAALKDYKTAVKNLIVAVKSAQGAASSSSTTTSTEAQ